MTRRERQKLACYREFNAIGAATHFVWVLWGQQPETLKDKEFIECVDEVEAALRFDVTLD